MSDQTANLKAASDGGIALHEDLVQRFNASMIAVSGGLREELSNILASPDLTPANAVKAQTIVHIQQQIQKQLNKLDYDGKLKDFIGEYPQLQLAALDALEALNIKPQLLSGFSQTALASLMRVDYGYLSALGPSTVQEVSNQVVTATIHGVSRGKALDAIAGTLDTNFKNYAVTYFDTGVGVYARTASMATWEQAGLQRFIYRGPKDLKNRPVCEKWVGKTFTLAEIKLLDKEVEKYSSKPLLPVLVYGGGWNCRHVWSPAIPEPEQNLPAGEIAPGTIENNLHHAVMRLSKKLSGGASIEEKQAAFDQTVGKFLEAGRPLSPALLRLQAEHGLTIRGIAVPPPPPKPDPPKPEPTPPPKPDLDKEALKKAHNNAHHAVLALPKQLAKIADPAERQAAIQKVVAKFDAIGKPVPPALQKLIDEHGGAGKPVPPLPPPPKPGPIERAVDPAPIAPTPKPAPGPTAKKPAPTAAEMRDRMAVIENRYNDSQDTRERRAAQNEAWKIEGKYFTVDRMPPEIRQNYLALKAKVNAALARERDIHEEKVMELRTLFYADAPARFKHTIAAKVDPALKKQIEDGLHSFRMMVGPDLGLNENVHPVAFKPDDRAKKRSFYDLENTVVLDPARGTSIVVHELGHYLEDKLGSVHTQAVDELFRRSPREKPQQMKKLGHGNYDPWEIAFKDSWAEPYTGKIYKRGVDSDKPNTFVPTNEPFEPSPWARDREVYATEVISMGLQRLYENPELFSRREPEFFDFIWKTLRP